VTDPAPPAKKPAGPLRWILLGCGILTGLFILGMGGCAGIFYFVYKGTDPIAQVGADYVKASPEMRKALGPDLTVRRHKTGWQVHTQNDRGNARISYDAQGAAGAGEVVVWLAKSAGTWTAVGARLRTPTGDAVEAGRPPKEHHRIDWD
jgi:hypothetical protein